MKAEARHSPAAGTEAGDGGRERSIPAVLDEAVRDAAGAPYLVDGGSTFSFADVRDQSEAVARRLRALGIGPGDRVVLWLPNGFRWVTLFFALLRIGAIVIPAGTRLRSADLRHVLADSGARALVYGTGFLGIDFGRMVRELLRLRGAGGLPALEHAIVADEGEAVPGAKRLADLPEDSIEAAGPDPAAAAIASYTSGTTGRPKGCLHSHRSLVRNGTVAAAITGLGAGERIACPVPFSHVFGFHMGVLQGAISGAAVINAEPYDPARTLDLASEHGASVLYAVPTMARELAAEQTRSPRDLGIRVALVAGAPVSQSLRRAILDSGLASSLSVVYGCTEAPTISQLPPQGDADAHPGSVGRPTPGVSVRVADRGTTEVLPPGEIGEIITRGYNVMLGYLGDPGGTATRFRDGWLITGDLGSTDAAGHLHFTSRADETLLVGGFNAYPRDIEALLEEMPGIGEVAVIGVPDDRLGQVPMAWIADAQVGEDDVLAWSRRNLASFKRPRYVRVTDALPRLGSGKIARVRLREQARRLLPALPWERAR